jgi:hypothetical protein
VVPPLVSEFCIIFQTNDLAANTLQNLENKGDNLQNLRNKGVAVFLESGRHNPEAGGFWLDLS